MFLKNNHLMVYFRLSCRIKNNAKQIKVLFLVMSNLSHPLCRLVYVIM